MTILTAAEREFDPTDKQAEILRVVFRAADAGNFLTLPELQAGLSYGSKCSPQAIRCSIGILQNRNMLSLVSGKDHGPPKQGQRLFIKPTPVAYRRFRPVEIVPL